MTSELQARLIWEAIAGRSPDPCHDLVAGGHAARMFLLWYGNGAVAKLSPAKRESLAKQWVAEARPVLVGRGILSLADSQRIAGERGKAQQLQLL